MLRISNVRIGTKLTIISSLGVVLVIGMNFSAMHGYSLVRDANLTALTQARIARDSEAMKASARGLRIGVRDLSLAESDVAVKEALDFFTATKKTADELLNALLSGFRSEQDRERGRKLKTILDQYDAAARELIPLKAKMFDLEAKGADTTALEDQIAVREHALPRVAQLEGLIEQIVEKADTTEQEDQEAAAAAMTWAQRLGVGIGAAVVLVLVGSALFGEYSIARPLRALVRPLEDLAAGNFAVTIPGVDRKDEVGLIAAAAEAVAEKVGATISNIKLAATEVTNASAEISTSTTDLSQRTEEQAASLEETSASMEEISSTVKKNADSAREANTLATDTSTIAERGGAVVSNAVAAMARIEELSRKISDIIGVIDEIARQTNLLALNAAVEAARAGDAGRGFAVVASEVRSLAQRSSQAAKDIKDLITNSNSQVKDGVGLVNKAGKSLNEIVASIKKVATTVAAIADASIEQSSGIEQVNKALLQMDEVTQQNSALVEENAATAKTLEQQAKSMDQRVAAFHLRADAARDSLAAAATSVAAEPQPVAEAGRVAAAPQAAAAPVMPKRPPVATPKSKHEPVAARKRVAGGGPARRMQTALATAIREDADWQEF